MKIAFEHESALLRQAEPADSYRGGDVKAWQCKAKPMLAALLGLDKMISAEADLHIEYEQKIEGATEVRFTFQSEPGYRVPCHLWLPDRVEKPPVMICLQGHSSGMHISLGRPKYEGDEKVIQGGDRDFCVRAVKEGYAAVALEQRSFGECGEHKSQPCFEASLTALLMGRTTVGERVWDVMRLIDVLEAHFAERVNTERIGCMGNSGGGTVTAYVAALEKRIVLAMPSCAMCTYKDSIGAMKHCSCNYVPHIAEHFDMNDLMAMAAPVAFVQVSGAEDPIFPLFGAEEVYEKGKKAYEALGAAERCVLVKGAGGHRFYADDAWPKVHNLMG